jgi:cell wall-associated NlpC family hydrolase
VFRRVLVVLALAGGTAVLLPATAGAATPPPVGRLATPVQDTFQHRLRIAGWAYDPARTTASVSVTYYIDGKRAGRVVADDASPNVNAKYHVAGRHQFAVTIAWTATARTITIKTTGVRAGAPATTLSTTAVRHYYPPAGTRIIVVAKRYVGVARYVEGGASPKGFDCSGYTRYVYSQAKVKTLVHNAESQRRSMKRISAGSARPGDLVFYLSGGSAYHVAIYAGHGMQYAAATVRDGIRYQRVWSSSVVYGTVTH